MGIFDSILGITKDVVDVVKAPVEIAIDVTREVTKPVADAAKEIVEEVKDLTDTENE